MKLRQCYRFAKFGILAGGALALVASARPPLAQSSEAPNLNLNGTVRLLAAKSGNFVTAEAPTTGTARIVEENGERYLELDSAFSTTDQAPDLHVLLETLPLPPRSYDRFGSYVNLGGLQAASGAQRYPIPDAIDLTEYKSVAIWCRMANATMGYAPLLQ